MNTAVEIYYKDANNYKSSYVHVFKGLLNPKDVIRLEKALDPDLGFVPTCLELRHAMIDENKSARTDADSAWHSITGIHSTLDAPEDRRTFKQFVDEAEKIDWENAAFEWDVASPENDDD